MKVGILSMQRVINNGSLLQAYGLKRVLESMGHKVEFVDFKIDGNDNGILSWKDRLNKFNKYLYILLQIFWKLSRLDFSNWNLSISESIVRHNFLKDYMKVLNLTCNPNYSAKVDILVFGSDEVFNTTQYVDKGIGYAWQLYGADNKADKLVSYAASFGYTTYEKLKEYGMIEKASTLLSNFENISVRDLNSFEIIKKLTGVEPNINIDPVLLYDFRDIQINKPKIDNFILVYAYPGRINSISEINAIKTFAKNNKKKLICVNMFQTWCDDMIYAHPFELLSYFRYADYVVTDTFHGAVLSIKYNKQFVQIIRDSSAYSNSQKVGYLLQSLGLEDRVINDIRKLDECMHSRIDYKRVNDNILMEKRKSMHYLKQALKQ